MTTTPDIVVVGAGPCGSVSAYTAAKLGSKVLVCEEHNQVGKPNHCAGHLSISSLQKLGIKFPSEILENKIMGAKIFSPNGNQFVLRCKSPVTYVLDREKFDKHLAELAMNAGAQYSFNSRVKSLLFESGYAKGVVLKNGEKIKSNMIIDAEGCSSSVLKQSGLFGLSSSTVVRGIQAEVDSVENVDTDMVELYLGSKVAPDFFAWIIPKTDGSAKVGLATSKGNPRLYLEKVMKKHPVASQKLKHSKITRLAVHPIPLAGPIQKTYCNGFLTVGDAASQVKATTGGGVVFGATCAKIAGEVAAKAVQFNNFSEEFLSSYEIQWRQAVDFELKVMLQLRRMLNSLSDSRTDYLIGLCNRLGVDKVLEKVGDVDFQGRSLVPMMRYPGTLAVVGYFVCSYLTSSLRK
ncbi:MAG: NAD(P)/FAD-dependent oxidoreductase [Candidatus Bathyarchaeota archaeon]|nr:MAG: NAD(P)/FAD-dependent oxidoreductase [Candidatus Bathyarchaeota archaeon]